jgi:sulfatase modifying factor 1
MNAPVSGRLPGLSTWAVASAVLSAALVLVLTAAEPRQATPTREVLTIPGLELRLVKISRGSFLMGQPDGYEGSSTDEKPQTKVTFTRDFWLGATEVSVGQFKRFVDATGYVTTAEHGNQGIFTSKNQPKRKGLSWRNPGIANYAQTDAHPVFGLSWDDCMQFCDWLNDRERAAGRLPAGYLYRLPSEAQWEYVARHGTTEDNFEPMEFAWYGANSGGVPHPVGTKQPNPWGVHDLQGNGWEWTHGWYGRYPGGEVEDYEGPVSPQGRDVIKPHRSMRGSSWNDRGRHGLMTTNRWSTWGMTQNQWVTFRVALVPDVPPPPGTPVRGALAAAPASVDAAPATKRGAPTPKK